MFRTLIDRDRDEGLDDAIESLRDRVGVLDDAIEPLRRPAYTGENRCIPCTALNSVLVLVAVAAASRRDRRLGVVIGTIGALSIWLRGYVVPGTPRFAPRLAEPLPVEFRHGPTAGDSDSIALTPDRGVDPETVFETLLEVGVVVADGDRLVLADGFYDAWLDRMADLRALPGPELAARTAAASFSDVEGSAHGDRVLLAGDSDAWLDRAVAIAEAAAVETLRNNGVPEAVAPAAARPLREFLDTCPACGGPVVETTFQRCCGGPGAPRRTPDQPVLACADCDAVVHSYPPE